MLSCTYLLQLKKENRATKTKDVVSSELSVLEKLSGFLISMFLFHRELQYRDARFRLHFFTFSIDIASVLYVVEVFEALSHTTGCLSKI